MRSIRLAMLVALAALPSVTLAAPVASVFGGRIACAVQSGVQSCQGDISTRVESWDGVPLDVNVTLPPAAQDGPFPLIIELNGWSLPKAGPDISRATDGYAVLSFSARGFHGSCGSPAARAPDLSLANPDVCRERGWIRLADARYEGRDAQYLAGLLADEGIVFPDRVGVTGFSYGGGQTMILAALRNRTMMPDGMLVPWKSPGGLDMTVAAGAALIPWSDLVYALTPTGRTLDYRVDNSYGTRGGVQKMSWNRLLYAAGLGTGFYAPIGADPAADITAWNARLEAGEPYDADPLLTASVTELTRHHSAYYIDDSIAPAPLFIYNAWTDDLFPADEGVRFWRKTKSKHPDAEIALQFADGFGHPRAGLGGNSARPQQRVNELFARHLKMSGGAALAPLETWTQGCGGSTEEGPIAAADWDAIHPGEVRYRARGSKRFGSAGGKAANATLADPWTGSPCKLAAAEDDPGAATYRLPAVEGAGFTLLGSPTVVAELAATSPAAQVAARLWDVGPDGMQALVSHSVYRPRTDNGGTQVFQLHPNGWHFAAGHVAKLELLGQSSPYVRASNGVFTVTVSRLELRLPVREVPAGKTIKPPAAAVQPSGAREPVGCSLAPLTGCVATPAGSALAVVISARAERDRLVWRARKGPAIDAADLGDPGASTDYALCLYDKDGELVLGAVAPAGGAWAPSKGGFKYSDRRAGTGIRSLSLRAGAEGKSSILATGQGAHLGVPTPPVDAPLTLQLATSDGTCWAATFEAPSKNTARVIKAKSR